MSLRRAAVPCAIRAPKCPGKLTRDTVAQKALARAITVIARADDSIGIVGDACRRLLNLHPNSAAAGHAPNGSLVDWMVTNKALSL